METTTRSAIPEANEWSTPDGGVVRKTFMVPADDGILLATDVYLPVGGSGPWPAVLERTPYGRRALSRWDYEDPFASEPMSREEIGVAIARRGYAVVFQDCRGRHDSGGRFIKYVHEADDGRSTLAWLVAQDFCSGRVGTMGMSYAAHVQTALAALQPPGLVCMILDSGGFWNAFREGIRQGGAFELKQAVWAHRNGMRQARSIGDRATEARLAAVDLADWLSRMPWERGASPLSASPEYEDYLLFQWESVEYSEYWAAPALCAARHYDRFRHIPTFVLGSWYDAYVRSAIRHFEALGPGNGGTRLVMGPWTHGARAFGYAGEADFGPEAPFAAGMGAGYLEARIRWFDRWLKDIPPPCDEPAVKLFVMGGGEGGHDEEGRLQHGGCWRDFPSWPIARSAIRKLFLRANGDLASDRDPASRGWRDLSADPHRPVPSLGGTITSGEPLMEGGAFDQREILRRSSAPISSPAADVLCFTSAVLDDPVTLVGETKLVLAFECDCPDADIHVRLLDIYPGASGDEPGPMLNVAQGVLRLGFRNDWQHSEPLEPGARHTVQIELTPTANRFCAGHRIGILITGSSFPQFDVNPNSGDGGWQDARVARTRFYCDGTSWVELPMIEAAGLGGKDSG